MIRKFRKTVKVSVLWAVLFVLCSFWARADILDRIEHKLERVRVETNGLVRDIACINQELDGIPFAPIINNDGNLYPIELATAPVFLSRVTGLSRFAPTLSPLGVCDTNVVGGTWFRNTADESWLFVNPINPNNIIVVTHQDRWTGAPFIFFGGIFLGDTVLYSLDGGVTWNEADVTLSKCQGPTLPRSNQNFDSASDPNIIFDEQGNAYMTSLSFNIFANIDEALILLTSTNQGQSWSKPQSIVRDNGFGHFIERQTLTADPYRPNTLYAVWEDEQALIGGAASFVNFSRSANNGTTWEPSLSIITTPIVGSALPFPLGAKLQVLPDPAHTLVVTVGDVVDANDGSPSAPWRMLCARSSDGGNTWTSSTALSNLSFASISDPDEGTPIGSSTATVDVALNPAINPPFGQLYAVFQSLYAGVIPGQGGTMISTSLNGGATWSAPMGVNTGGFLPSVAVASDGVVGVLFYDFRHHSSGSSSLETDVWLKLYSSDLTTVLDEIRLTPVSFDIRQSLIRNIDLYVGSYCKLQASGNDFMASFCVTNPPYGIGTTPQPGSVFTIDTRHRQDVIFARVTRP